MKPEEKKYYSRQIILEQFGEIAQQKLLQAKVLVIGAGGLGCPVSLYLTGAGVGNISIIDYDVVDASNLPRQLLYDYTDIGKSKATAAVEHLKKKNPFVRILAIEKKLDAENALEIIKPFDLVIDCSDNFTTRYLVNDACVILDKPFISGSVVGFEGQVSVFNFNKGPTYRCLYPEPLQPGESPSCAEAGVINTITGWAGSLMAQEAIKVITGVGEVLSGRLSVLNVLNGTMNEFRFTRGSYFPTEIISVTTYCDENNFSFISLENFRKLNSSEKKTVLVDVREEWEIDELLEGSIHIPLADLPQRYNDFTCDIIGFICNKGERSRLAVRWATEQNLARDLYIIESQ